MKQRKFFIVGLMLALIALGLGSPAPARAAGLVYTVNSLADVTAFDGVCTLREAIISANGTSATECGPASADPDEIEFAVSGTITLGASLPAITDNLTIGGSNNITIDGADQYRMFNISSGKTFILSDMQLFHGFAIYEGGAIRNFGTLYVTNVQFVNNSSNAGGGAVYNYSIAEIRNSEFLNNTLPFDNAHGGAILNPGILNLDSNKFEENYAGLSTGRGGAVWSSGPLIISNSQFVKNEAGNGGAIYARREVNATTLSINGIAFDQNLAVGNYPEGQGGALLVDNLAVTAQNSLFTNNGGQSGGAFFIMPNGTLTLMNSTLRENSQTTNGAGLYNQGTAHLTGVTLSGNRADHGGGINNFGTLFLTNVTLSGNQATYGGGLKNEGGTARLSNVTFFGNSASGTSGGGILNTGQNTSLNLTNVLVANSPTGGNCAFSTSPILSQFNLSSDNTCNFGVTRDNLNVMLNPLANNGGSTATHLPQYGSPAIDNGTDDDAPSVDQRGITRPQGTYYDVGSVEVAPCGKPAAPTLKKPAPNKIVTTTRPTLKWNAAMCAKKYTVLVKDATTGKTADKQAGLTVLKYKTDALTAGKKYKWFVKACNPPNGCARSVARFFTIQ